MSTQTSPAESPFATAFVAPGAHESQERGRTTADGAGERTHAWLPTDHAPTSTDAQPGTQPPRPDGASGSLVGPGP